MSVLLALECSDQIDVCLRELQSAGISLEHMTVATREELERALADARFDVVVAGWCERLTPSETLQVTRGHAQGLPVVVVCDGVDDGAVAEVFEHGAVAVVDLEHIRRLGPIVRRELREARNRSRLREAEHELRESSRRWLAVLEASGITAFTLDSHARYDGFYGPWPERCRQTPASLLGALIGTGLSEQLAARLHDAARQALEGRGSVVDWDEVSNGEICACQAVFSPRRAVDTGEHGVIVLLRDVTEDKRVLAQLMVTDRVETVGTLTAGIVHEINNPLMAIVGNLDMALEDLASVGKREGGVPGLAETSAGLQDARKAAERLRCIVHDITLFCRTTAEAQDVDVAQILESAIRLAWNEIKHRARLVRRFEPSPPVRANASRLGQVFLDLLVNAAQAIPEGSASANEISVRLQPDADGGVVVEISDTGCGMSDDVVARIFSPFFSTKPPGDGSGLGLAVCSRFVTSLGGRIEVQTSRGQGSAFRVTLPGARPAAALSDVHAPPLPPARRRGRVLVIDDDPSVASAVRRALASQHDVVACDGRGALKLIRSGDRFDVILCDVMMPDLTGEEFHAKLSEVAPSLLGQIVFVTGGVFTQNAKQFLRRVSNPCLEKPVDLATLRQIVGDLVR